MSCLLRVVETKGGSDCEGPSFIRAGYRPAPQIACGQQVASKETPAPNSPTLNALLYFPFLAMNRGRWHLPGYCVQPRALFPSPQWAAAQQSLEQMEGSPPDASPKYILVQGQHRGQKQGRRRRGSEWIISSCAHFPCPMPSKGWGSHISVWVETGSQEELQRETYPKADTPSW